MADRLTYAELLQQNAKLQQRLTEAEETLLSISVNEVDAFVISTNDGPRILRLEGTDRPYQLLVEEMQQGAVTISADGTILYCNRRFLEMFELAHNQIVAHQFDQFVIADERERFAEFRRNSTGGAEQEFNLYGSSNEAIPVNITTSLLPSQINKVICLIITDLRQRKLAEQQTIVLEVERQRIKVLADFVQNTSHDLRTPITIILNSLYNLAHIEDAEKRLNKIHYIETYILYLNRVLEQFQQIAVLDSIIELDLHSGIIKDVIVDAIGNVEKTALEKNVTVSAELSLDTMDVRFDNDTLHYALTELMENAIRHSPPGGQVLICSNYFTEKQLTIKVINEGSGIDMESLPHIFERFYKVDKARRMTGGGGLGLSIVKRIVELHHGSIEVDSIQDDKTVFRIKLPVTQTRKDNLD